MPVMEELETTYLLKTVPDGLNFAPQKELLDIYLPSTAQHPILRIRKRGEKYEITKKEPVDNDDASRQLETTIGLTPEEYAELSKVSGRRIRKTRYYLEREGVTFEIDVFQDELKGLVLVDVEFQSLEEKEAFIMPDFCLRDITQEKFVAGGILAGKNYKDIESDLKRFSYEPIFIN